MRIGGEETTAGRFVGRERELSTLDDCLSDVLHGRPRVAIVEGPAGIGKTTLIDQFLAAADGGARVVRGSGEQAERSLAYGLVDQLLRAADAPHAVFASPSGSADHVNLGLRLLQAFGALEETSRSSSWSYDATGRTPASWRCFRGAAAGGERTPWWWR